MTNTMIAGDYIVMGLLITCFFFSFKTYLDYKVEQAIWWAIAGGFIYVCLFII